MGSPERAGFRFEFVTWVTTVSRSKEKVSVGVSLIVGAYNPYADSIFNPIIVCHNMDGGTFSTPCSSRAWTARSFGENSGELIGTPALPAGRWASITGVKLLWSP